MIQGLHHVMESPKVPVQEIRETISEWMITPPSTNDVSHHVSFSQLASPWGFASKHCVNGSLNHLVGCRAMLLERPSFWWSDVSGDLGRVNLPEGDFPDEQKHPPLRIRHLVIVPHIHQSTK